MRTTVDIADELMRRARKKAADEGVPLRRILEDALRSYLKGPGRTGGRYKLR